MNGGNTDSLERRVIIAFRHKYPSETREEYYKSPNKFKSYLVLKEFDDKLLVIDLKKYDESSPKCYVVKRSEFNCLAMDVYIGNNLVTLFKENLVDYSENAFDDVQYQIILNDFMRTNFSTVCSDEERIMFHDLVSSYYKSKINVGSIVVIRAKGKSNTYYVTEKLEHTFSALKLCYENGVLKVSSNKPKYISYYSSYESIVGHIATEEDMKKLIKSK